MSEYPEFTPTMEQVRAAYAHDPEAEYRDPVGFPVMQRENLRAFDRWLAAHDAEVRAGVVTEEPEWQYECRVDSALDWRPCTEDAATCPRGSERRRRRAAGPWVPLEQEGAETDE